MADADDLSNSAKETLSYQKKDDSLVSFQCCACLLSIECKFGKLEFEKLRFSIF